FRIVARNAAKRMVSERLENMRLTDQNACSTIGFREHLFYPARKGSDMTQQPFDPNQHISKVKGRDYLEAKWRIAWLRSEHPEAVLETDLMSHDDTRAIIRARVSLPNGGSATGWGSETSATSETYIEKAETKAIGRALTALGFGTPLSTDREEAVAPHQRSQS